MTWSSVPPSATPRELPSADDAVAHTLLNCLLREVSGPEQSAALAHHHLVLRLPHDGTLLRVAVRRTSLLGAHRFTGPAGQYAGGRWSPIGWRRLAEHIRAELAARTGLANDEFVSQVAASHRGVTAGLAQPRPDRGSDPHAFYLASERSLVLGHRFHPAPKARDAGPAAWQDHAPEAAAAFPVRLLAVRDELVVEEYAAPGATAPLDRLGRAPDGYRLLPVHPWQYDLLRERPALVAALRRGDVRDLGAGGTRFAATASVRTLYDGETFLKFSLNVRITNCLRKNARYELSGAVALTRLLGPVAADLAARFPGSAVLREPAYRSLALPDAGGAPDVDLLEGFGVIVRRAWPAGPGPTPPRCWPRPSPTNTPQGPRTSPACCPPAPGRWRCLAGGRPISTCSCLRCWPPTSTTGSCSNPICRTSWSASATTASRARSSSATWRAPSCSPDTTGPRWPPCPSTWPGRSPTTPSRAGPGSSTACWSTTSARCSRRSPTCARAPSRRCGPPCAAP